MAKAPTLSIKITQASLNQTALDWPQNMANHYAAIDLATAEGSDLLLTHELGLTGYEVNDDFQRTDNNRIYDALCNIAAYANAKDPNLIVSVGAPWRLQLRDAFEKAAADPDIIKNSLYDRLHLPFNVQVLIGGGHILGMTAKTNLYRNERGYENRYFNEWSFRDVAEYALLTGVKSDYGTISIPLPDGKIIPFGRPLVYIADKDGKAYIHAQAICEDKWAATKYDSYPNNDSRYERMNVIPSIARYLGTKDGLLLEIANASPPARLKQDKHMHLNELASHYADVVIDTDGLGSSGATYAQNGHQLIAQHGKTIASGRRLQFRQIAATTSIVKVKSAAPALAAKTHAMITRDFKARTANPQTTLSWEDKDGAGAWDNPANPDRWKEELIRNQALWMFDYMRKTGARGVMQALSGGKDSSFNCAMVRVMVALAMNDLGVDGFCREMSHLPYIDKILAAEKTGGREAAIDACMNEMLTAVYMGTNNSSYQTWYAAKTLMDGGDFDGGKGRFKGIGGKFVERNVQDLLDFYGYIFAVKDTTKMPREKKLEVMEEIAAFINASPHDHTQQQIMDWADRIYKKYPEVERLVSAALPGQGVAYENIQARGRQVLIQMFSNIERKLLVANPNLDEAYGAYATFGGDLHSGNVNWNGGIHKSDQEAVMQYLEDHGVQGVMDRLISLAPANKNRPSAELQPKKGDSVAQFDEDALQGTFPQKAALSRLRHHTKKHTPGGERWMNAGELYARARADTLFNAMDDSELFNSVAFFYLRWEGPAQHKIQAAPIAPTHGESVDKQTSLRTPNLSGQSKDEIVLMGIDLMHGWAKRDGLNWGKDAHEILRQRAWQDKSFVRDFYIAMENREPGRPNMTYNLGALYETIKQKGWDGMFTPLAPGHPLHILYPVPKGL